MMIDETIFDDIRPYRDEEIPAAMHRIADNDLFPLLSSFAFPDRNVEDVVRKSGASAQCMTSKSR